MLEKDLTIGETVIGHWASYGRTLNRIGKVKAIGKISYTVQFNGETFTRRFNKSGYETGEGYYRGDIQVATPELIREVKAENHARYVLSKLKDIKWDEVLNTEREAVFVFLKERGIIK